VTDPLANLPPAWPEDVLPAIRAAVAASGRTLVALDDDPTGVQTVHDTPVLARWDLADLAAELREAPPLVFVLTNSRSVPEAAAVALNREVAANLLAASRETGRGVVLLSRSDSTLRGHFPAETDALADALGGVDGVLLVPAFVAGGRVTVGGVHYVRDGGRFVPAGETEFARDATFGYRASDLREWVAEKTGGRVPAGDVAALDLRTIREGGPAAVAAALGGLRGGRVGVADAVTDRDLEVLALGALLAEAAGARLLYRTGASFARARAGLPTRPLLSRADLLGPDAPVPAPGLVAVGSHVRTSGEQLAVLLEEPGVAPVELAVPRVVDPASRDAEVGRARAAAERALDEGSTPVVFTSRELVLGRDPEDSLRLSRAVSAALVAVVAGVRRPLAWVVGKGGITSSDVGTVALRSRRALVLGQVAAGVPVWRLGPESARPGIPYVVFPGNVGGPGALAEVVRLLRG
jgi:uncharacterized protein YgbK (DUF1537 family)